MYSFQPGAFTRLSYPSRLPGNGNFPENFCGPFTVNFDCRNQRQLCCGGIQGPPIHQPELMFTPNFIPRRLASFNANRYSSRHSGDKNLAPCGTLAPPNPSAELIINTSPIPLALY